MIDETIVTGEAAKERGLVDHLIDEDDLRPLITKTLGREIDLERLWPLRPRAGGSEQPFRHSLRCSHGARSPRPTGLPSRLFTLPASSPMERAAAACSRIRASVPKRCARRSAPPLAIPT